MAKRETGVSANNYLMYVYDMPYAVRRRLCEILDVNNKWEELAGVRMMFDVNSVQRMGHAILRNQSPTDELLTLWGTQNHTVLELFILLSKMHHYQAMKVLKDLVDPRFHRLIYEGEENLSRLFVTLKNEDFSVKGDSKVQNDVKFGAHNFHKTTEKQGPGREKVLLGGTVNGSYPNMGGVANNQTKQCVDEARGISDNPGPMVDYSVLEVATDFWDKKRLLGKGGFGTVYKGVWKNTHVAIKRLEAQKDNNDTGVDEMLRKTQREQSLRELKYLNSCRHDNILPLYGFSIGGPFDCLVYQYMSNGSLEDRLLCRDPNKAPLTWHQRNNIAIGTARGLQFLHTVSEKPLIHGDIKSANILLDPNMEPKIGDFGLAREGPLQQYTHVKVSRVHGTRPYLPDEFLRSKKLSIKVDTFSFGIVLFELATGLRAYDDNRAYKFLKDEAESTNPENVHLLIDSKAGPDEGARTFFRFYELGLKCVSARPKDRPEMVDVLQQLVSSLTEEEQSNGADVFALSSEDGLIPLISQLGVK